MVNTGDQRPHQRNQKKRITRYLTCTVVQHVLFRTQSPSALTLPVLDAIAYSCRAGSYECAQSFMKGRKLAPIERGPPARLERMECGLPKAGAGGFHRLCARLGLL